VWYDTVLELTKPDSFKFGSQTVAEYTCRFVSNNPSFAFTYAYTAFRKELLLEQFKGKFDDIFWTEPPKVRNPTYSMGLEKSIMYPVMWLAYKRFHYIAKLDELAKTKVKWPVLVKRFKPFKKIMAELKEAALKAKADKAVEAKAVRKLKVKDGDMGVKLPKAPKQSNLKKKVAKAPIRKIQPKKPKKGR
jgi:hypothetical protein